MALHGRAAKVLEEQLHGLHEDYPQCEVSEDQYQATVRHSLPGFHILTLELQLQPEFKAFVRQLHQPASGAVLRADQLRHAWLGPHGEIEQRAYEQKLGARVTWRRHDDLRRVVRTILDEFDQTPPIAAAVGANGGSTQTPLPTYNQAFSQAPPPSYTQAPPAYAALQPPQQPAPAVQLLAFPASTPASLPVSPIGVHSSAPSMSVSAKPQRGMSGMAAAPTLAPAAYGEMPFVPMQLAEPPLGLGARPALNGGSGTENGTLEPVHPGLSPPIETPPPSSIPLEAPNPGDNREDAPRAALLPPAARSPRSTASHAGFGASASPSPGFGARVSIESKTSVEADDDAALQQIKAANVEAAKANLDRREELAAAQRDVDELRAKMATVEQERQRLIAEYERVMSTRSLGAIRAALRRGVEAADARCTELETGMVLAVRGTRGRADSGGTAAEHLRQQADGRAHVDEYLQTRHAYHRRAALLQGVDLGQLQPPT